MQPTGPGYTHIVRPDIFIVNVFLERPHIGASRKRDSFTIIQIKQRAQLVASHCDCPVSACRMRMSLKAKNIERKINRCFTQSGRH